MANDLLIHAIHEAGLTNADIADVVQVDPKTVERWISGRVPHPRYRSLLASRLGVGEDELWPETARARGRKGVEEIAGAWSRRDDKDAPDWRALLRQANSQVDLIGYSLHSVLHARGATKALAGKAAEGCQIRIAIADPDSEHVHQAELLHRGAGRLAQRIQQTKEQLLDLDAQANLEVRQHQAHTSHTILRFDEELLLTVHVAGTPGLHAPLLHIRRHSDYGIFDQLTGHIETIWQTAQPFAVPDATTPAVAKPGRSGADQILDKLDTVWRPR